LNHAIVKILGSTAVKIQTEVFCVMTSSSGVVWY